ncbi:unnamed protein product [Alopecurus aequalis]
MRSDGDVKSFFRQQKARSGGEATKPTGGVYKKAAQLPQKKPAALLHPTPDHVVGADARREEEGRDRKAREFDMDMRYGPCLGLTRAQRWHRAAALGLAPPSYALCSDDQPCLWEGHV